MKRFAGTLVLLTLAWLAIAMLTMAAFGLKW